MTYKIEKNIHMPELFNLRRYPCADMIVGDSFAMPLAERSTFSNWSLTWKERGGHETWKFATRKVSDTTCRVWRIE